MYEIKTMTNDLFMVTSWNKIGINIGNLFSFLAYDPERNVKNDILPPPPGMPLAHGLIKTSNFSFFSFLSIWMFYHINFIRIEIT